MVTAESKVKMQLHIYI